MDCGVDTVITKRRRPNETAIYAKTVRQPFGEEAEKDLPRPALTYLYNTEMNQVDRGDQRRAAYLVQQRQQKGWKAIFYTMIGIVVVNSYLLSAYAPVPEEKKFTKQIKFREALCKALFAHSTAVADGAAITGVKMGHHRVSMKRAPCVMCKYGAGKGRRGIRGQQGRVLLAISPNIVSRSRDRHIARATTGCLSCQASLCRDRGCWEAFHSGVDSA